VLALDFSSFIVAYLFLGLSLFMGLALFYDRRDRATDAARQARSARHCARCGHLYSARSPEGEAPCPRCGLPNQRLRF
jgi:hypothetical protein